MDVLFFLFIFSLTLWLDHFEAWLSLFPISHSYRNIVYLSNSAFSAFITSVRRSLAVVSRICGLIRGLLFWANKMWIIHSPVHVALDGLTLSFFIQMMQVRDVNASGRFQTFTFISILMYSNCMDNALTWVACPLQPFLKYHFILPGSWTHHILEVFEWHHSAS